MVFNNGIKRCWPWKWITLETVLILFKPYCTHQIHGTAAENWVTNLIHEIESEFECSARSVPPKRRDISLTRPLALRNEHLHRNVFPPPPQALLRPDCLSRVFTGVPSLNEYTSHLDNAGAPAAAMSRNEYCMTSCEACTRPLNQNNNESSASVELLRGANADSAKSTVKSSPTRTTPQHRRHPITTRCRKNHRHDEHH